jgi:hypothetical protein
LPKVLHNAPAAVLVIDLDRQQVVAAVPPGSDAETVVENVLLPACLPACPSRCATTSHCSPCG